MIGFRSLSDGHASGVRHLVALIAVVLAATTLALPAPAGTDGPPPHEQDGHEHGPTGRDNPALPSFNESGGCGELQGARGPYARERGYLGDSEPIRGPWGDFYGRTVGLVRSQLVPVHMPMTDASWHVFWVHERVAPALEQAAQNLRDAQAAGKRYTIRASHSWSFHPATIPPGRHMSFHGVGAAIDINSDTNPYRGDNVLVTDMPAWFVRAFTDAGFCWGGDWQSIKDPMHFSWMGPAHTPGYSQPGLQPVLTEENRKFRTQIDIATAGDTSASGVAVPVVADFDRDGAADLGRVTQGTLAGHGTLTFSQAHHGYETCVSTPTTRTKLLAADRIPLAQDFTRDGRPDLAFADVRGETVRVNIHKWQDLSGRKRRKLTAIPTAGLLDLRAADFDADGIADIVVHRQLATRTRIEIWAGPHFDQLTAKKLVRRNIVDVHLATGYDDLDSRPDVYLLGSDGRLQVLFGPDLSSTRVGITFVIPQEGERLFVADYDGDGRRDLWLASSDLSARVFLGGRRSSGADLDYWFVEDTVHWAPGQGCGPVPATGDFDRVTIDGVPEGVAAADPHGSDHRVTAPNRPDRSGWSLYVRGEPVAVATSPDGSVLADVALVDGRGRITAISVATGHRLWTKGMPSGVTPVAAWSDGAAVTVVGRTGDGRTDVQRYEDGTLTHRETHAGLAPTHAVPLEGGIAVLGVDAQAETALALVASGSMATQVTLPHHPTWLGTAGGRVVAVTGLTPTRVAVMKEDGAGSLTMVGRTGLGGALIIAGDLSSPDTAVFALRKPRGRTVVKALDLATLDKTRLGRTPFEYEPVGVSVSGTVATVAVQRITDGAWRLVELGL
jgi:hypothetical protein